MPEVPPQRLALGTREHRGFIIGLDQPSQVLADDRQDHSRHDDHTLTRPRLGRPRDKLATAQLGDLPDDPDRPSFQVNVTSPERDQLAPAHTAENSKQHKRPISRIDGLS